MHAKIQKSLADISKLPFRMITIAGQAEGERI